MAGTDFDWSAIRFLESAGNLKLLLKEAVGRMPSTAIAREVAACLQQGRLFYQSSESTAIEIRPLIQFYGLSAFAKAIVIARELRSLSTLRQSHGLTDISVDNSRLQDLRVRIANGGTFQDFNDVIAPLSRLRYHDVNYMQATLHIPSTMSKGLVGVELSLRDVLSRIPGLEDLYSATFKVPANVVRVTLGPGPSVSDQDWTLRVDDHEVFKDREHLVRIVGDWRSRFPFIAKWRLVEATRAWDRSVLEFANRMPPTDEFDEKTLKEHGNSFGVSRNSSTTDIASILDPLAGGYTGAPAAIAPFNQGIFFAEFSLHFLALFLLSSLVRYRPDSWIHAVSRTTIQNAPADDELLALLERLLTLNQHNTPLMVSRMLNPIEDRRS